MLQGFFNVDEWHIRIERNAILCFKPGEQVIEVHVLFYSVILGKFLVQMVYH